MEIRTELFALPADLQVQVEAVAAEENRAAGEVLRDAIERYLSCKRRQRLFTNGEQRAHEMGLTEEDVPGLIKEHRQDTRRERAVFKTEDLSDAELTAIAESEMDPRHNHLNAELE